MDNDEFYEALNGDFGISYEELQETCWKAAYVSLKKYGNIETVDDLFSICLETFLEKYKRIKKGYDPERGDFAGYLYTYLKNELTDYFNSKIMRQEMDTYRRADLRTFGEVDCTTPEASCSTNEIFQELHDKAKQIPNGEFVFSYINRKSVREISEIAEQEGIEISKSHVNRIISLIKSELKNILERRDSEGI